MFDIFGWFRKKTKKINVYIIIYYAFSTQKRVVSLIYTTEKIKKKKNLDISNGYFEEVQVLFIYED